MLYCPRFNSLFVHIPKTGGTSLNRLMRDLDPGAISVGWHHSPASEGITLLGAARWVQFHSFAVVRHPADRLLSWFSMFKGHNPRMLREHPKAWMDTIITMHPHLKPLRSQSSMLDAEVDEVLRYETLARDLASLARRLGWPEGWALPHMNPSPEPHDPWPTYWSRAELDYIEEVYAEDYTRFGYPLSTQP